MRFIFFCRPMNFVFLGRRNKPHSPFLFFFFLLWVWRLLRGRHSHCGERFQIVLRPVLSKTCGGGGGGRGPQHGRRRRRRLRPRCEKKEKDQKNQKESRRRPRQLCVRAHQRTVGDLHWHEPGPAIAARYMEVEYWLWLLCSVDLISFFDCSCFFSLFFVLFLFFDL